MDRELKTLRRTIALEGWVNRFDRQAFREIEDAYREMPSYTLKHSASQRSFIVSSIIDLERYPWLSTRIIKGQKH
ncbi:MAG: hypothetical protein QXE01_04865 [Sulfolobales archaeon]